MKRFSGFQIFFSLLVALCLVGTLYVVAIILPPEKPADLESATGLSTAELIVVANSECQTYKAILSSSAAGTDYETWINGMSNLLTSKQASDYSKKNNAVYDFAKLDISDKLQGRGAFTLQTLIFEGSELNGLQSGKWNMTRLKDFYPITFSTLAGNMANLSLEECGLTELSLGMQELTQQAKRVMAQANYYYSKQSSSSNNESQSCGVIKDEITTVRSTFLRGEASPQQISSILNRAASTWQSESRSYSGSKASWLNKMSELSLKLNGFVLTGSPSNGDQLLDQLGASFSLYQQFCD